MSFPYWPGEVLQTLAINGNNLSIVPGNTVVLPGGGGSAVSSFTDASISSLTVSSINGLLPGGQTISSFTDLYAQLGSISSLSVSSINGQQPNAVPSTISTFNDLTASQVNASSIQASTITVNTLVALSTISAVSTISSLNLQAQTANISSLNTSSFTADSGSISSLNVSLLSTNDILVSSINGVEFTPQQIVVSTLNTDSVNTNTMSSLVSYVGQQLVSTITFNPSVNISPQFNIDMNMGGFLTTLGTGLFGIAVAVPTTVGTLTYGLTKGLASLFEPRPINNINNNVFETFNYASQLQVSSFNEYISTIYRFTSTIPSTIVINNQPTFSTVSSTDVEIFVSTISQSSTPTCIRAVADPVQIVSTPWTVYQGFGEWVEIPGGGGSSNIPLPSTISLSTLQLAPSTILKGDLPQTLQVLSLSNTYNQVAASTYTCAAAPNDPNQGTYAVDVNNNPFYINSNFSTSQFALQNKQVAFSEVDFPVKDTNNSTITNLFINNASEPTLTYEQYPPGFPSTTLGKIQFLSSFNGGYSAVKISNQFDSNVSLTVGGQSIYATPMTIGNGVNGPPITAFIPDLDEWGILSISTSGGGIGKTEIINTRNDRQGVLTIAAPNQSTGGSTRILYLDAASTCLGVNNSAPQAQLDVGLGLNYTSPGSLAAFSGNRDGTLELTLQNQSAGSNASAFFFAVENTGAEYAGFGINSANLQPVYNTITEIPGASVQSGTIDIVIAPQSDHSSNAGIFLGYNDATYAHHINSNGALSFDASYTGGTINPGNFGTSNSVLITNGAGANPSWTNSVNLVNATVSSLTVGSNITWPETSFAAPKVFLQGGLSNSPVINTNVIASPYVDTLTFYKGFTNQDFPGGYICLAADNGLMGVNKIPDANIDLDVNGIICASNISTPQISTTQSYATQSIVSSLTATVVSTNTLTAATGSISSITQAINTTAVPYTRCPLTVAQNFDYFGSSYGHFNGTQSVVGGYFVNLNNSIGGGHAEADFIFPPPGLSSMMTCTATYFITNSNAPQTPTWVGNMTVGANGQLSTIQVFGDAGEDVYVSYIGFV